MKYMLFTYRDSSVQLDPEQRASVPAAVAAWCEEMDARGVASTDTYGPLTEMRTIRSRDGDTTVDPGPTVNPPMYALLAGFGPSVTVPFVATTLTSSGPSSRILSTSARLATS